MRKLYLSVLVVMMLGLSACAELNTGMGGDPVPEATETSAAQEVTSEPVGFYYDFDDMLVPKEMKYDQDASFVFETAQYRAGSLVFNGKVESLSLVDFFINNMAKDNWQKKLAMKSSRAILVFEKPRKSCMIKVTDESFSNTKAEVFIIELKPGVATMSENVLTK